MDANTGLCGCCNQANAVIDVGLYDETSIYKIIDCKDISLHFFDATALQVVEKIGYGTKYILDNILAQLKISGPPACLNGENIDFKLIEDKTSGAALGEANAKIINIRN